MFGFDKMFDFNRDGKLESWERAAQFQFMDEMMICLSSYFSDFFPFLPFLSSSQ